jgi:hypothetical protein
MLDLSSLRGDDVARIPRSPPKGLYVIFEPGQRIVFIGDSITDCGRSDRAKPYGDGYVSLVRGFVAAAYPGRPLS